MDKKLFFKTFLENPRQTGSVVQSSPFLARKIIEPINFKKARFIVELGAGTGAVTKKILRKMDPDCILMCFEIDKVLCKEMKKNLKDPRLKVIPDGAEKMGRYLPRFGCRKADFIVSELPLVSLPQKTGEEILKAVQDNLDAKGKYIQIQYSLLGKKKLQKIFPRIEILFTPFNIPPSFVYVCEK